MALSLFVIVFLISAGVAVAGWLVILGLARRVGPKKSGCGKCGYSAIGLSSFICPECGSDLRVVGINVGTTGMVWLAFLAIGLISVMATLFAVMGAIGILRSLLS